AEPGIEIVHNTQNVGYATGNNIGARRLIDKGCEIIVFANPDVSISTESLNSLVTALRSRPRAGCAGGLPLNRDGTAAIAARNRPNLVEKLILYGPLRRVRRLESSCRRHWIPVETLADGDEVYAVCGACVAIRATAFTQMDGLDEKTFLYEE